MTQITNAIAQELKIEFPNLCIIEDRPSDMLNIYERTNNKGLLLWKCHMLFNLTGIAIDTINHNRRYHIEYENPKMMENIVNIIREATT